MPTLQDVQTWRGQDVVDSDGDKIGTLEDIYLDRESGEPEWAAVRTGLFGKKVSFLPIEGASPGDGEIRVRHDKATVKDAPNIDADGELSPEEEQRLYEHYGRGYSRFEGEDRGERFSREDAGTTTGRGPVGRDTSGPTTDEAMTRSEEELRVGTAREESGRARLRKYVVTEEEQVSVPVSREEVRIEREPITGGNVDQALEGPAISEEEHEVVLHEERPVVEKQAVPKERVRMSKDEVTEERTVSEEVRKERIDPEGDLRPGDR
jgi:uncharacterized protein (TIGR02271 family)